MCGGRRRIARFLANGRVLSCVPSLWKAAISSTAQAGAQVLSPSLRASGDLLPTRLVSLYAAGFRLRAVAGDLPNGLEPLATPLAPVLCDLHEAADLAGPALDLLPWHRGWMIQHSSVTTPVRPCPHHWMSARGSQHIFEPDRLGERSAAVKPQVHLLSPASEHPFPSDRGITVFV